MIVKYLEIFKKLHIRLVFRLFSSIVVLLLLYRCNPSANSKFKFQDEALSAEERAMDLVNHLTLEQKISQMKHNSPAIDTFGIPEYNWWNECLHGVGRAGVATVFPQAIGMAASWDTQLIHRVASAISDEARAKHHHFATLNKRGIYMGLTFWSPNINIFRDPRWGRGQETYGEDPFLTSEMAKSFITGLQGDDPNYLKLVATAKHFAVHNGPEPLRHKFDIDVTDQDLYETYLPAFESAVKEAKVASVMCAYNRFRGTPCCGHSPLQNEILKKQWGFTGYVVSDCGAIADIYEKNKHNVVETPEEAAAMAVKAGTDLNCGNIYPYLQEAVENNLISEDEIDRAVIRLFTARFKLGMFDDPKNVKYANIPYDVVANEKNQELSLQASRESIVLLKNENKLLPLNKDIKSIAVIGPNADNYDVLLGNYHGTPAISVTVLQGIKEALPNVIVHHAEGSCLVEGYPNLTPIPSSALTPNKTSDNHGLNASYHSGQDFTSMPVKTTIDSTINFNWLGKSPLNGVVADEFGVQWDGYLTAPETGTYRIGLKAAARFAKLYLNNKLIVKTGFPNTPSVKTISVDLKKNEILPIKIEYYSTGTDPQVKLLWALPKRDLTAAAVEAAQKSDAVVMVMGLHPGIEGEQMPVTLPGFDGGDRTSIDLPEIQRKLIRKIHEVGKPVVLVIMGGSNIAFNWANKNIPAVLFAWYPGELGGRAIADILFGNYNPSAKLPVTFYRTTSDLPPFDDYSMDNRTYKFFKGDVLYPFGYGLSYTNFKYSKLMFPKTIDAGDEINVSVEVTNTGSMSGKEVVQLYVTDREASFRVPVRALIGFQKVYLKPGESKTITFKIKPQDYAMFNEQGNRVIEPGDFDISIGGEQPGFQGKTDAATTETLTGTFSVEGELVL